MSNLTFQHTIETLLKGNVICEVSDSSLFMYLLAEETQDNINQYLSKLGRGLAKTKDGTGFYCVYNDVENPKVRRDLISQFMQVATHWEALLLWLRLTRQASASAHPIGFKTVIKESELLASIEQSSSLQAELESIANKLKTKVRTGEPRKQLSGMLEFLVDAGFLIELKSSIYQGTARWSMLQDQMEFVREQDGIEHEEGAESDQEDLF